MHDPDGRAMKRRIERRYLGQLIQGCGKSWCANSFCKTGRSNSGISIKGEVISTKEALPMIKPLMDNVADTRSHMYFCTDEGSQRRRKLGEMMAAEGEYEVEWCIAANEAENGNLEAAREWLRNWAPKKSETLH
jgi:hypothetical protein